MSYSISLWLCLGYCTYHIKLLWIFSWYNWTPNSPHCIHRGIVCLLVKACNESHATARRVSYSASTSVQSFSVTFMDCFMLRFSTHGCLRQSQPSLMQSQPSGVLGISILTSSCSSQAEHCHITCYMIFSFKWRCPTLNLAPFACNEMLYHWDMVLPLCS